jgi:hypothetical protein
MFKPTLRLPACKGVAPLARQADTVESRDHSAS